MRHTFDEKRCELYGFPKFIGWGTLLLMWNHNTKVLITILECHTTVLYLSSSGPESETCDRAQEDEKR